MTARTARVLYDTTKTITVVSGIIGGILTFIAAGISDNYTLVGQAVPGDYDLKIIHIKQALDRYYNLDWGMVDRWDSKINDDAVENGYDRVRGIYQTILGKIFIVTDSERYATTIYSEKEYLKEINY